MAANVSGSVCVCDQLANVGVVDVTSANYRCRNGADLSRERALTDVAYRLLSHGEI